MKNVILNKAIVLLDSMDCIIALTEHHMAIGGVNDINAATILKCMTEAKIYIDHAKYAKYRPLVNSLAEILIDSMRSMPVQSANSQMNMTCGNGCWALAKVGYRSNELAEAMIQAVDKLGRKQNREVRSVPLTRHKFMATLSVQWFFFSRNIC